MNKSDSAWQRYANARLDYLKIYSLFGYHFAAADRPEIIFQAIYCCRNSKIYLFNCCCHIPVGLDAMKQLADVCEIGDMLL